MELTKIGTYVCGNPYCHQFKSPFLYPRAKKNQQKKGTHSIAQQKTAMRCCPKASFDVRTFFEFMEYIGSVQSRTNQYFCYNFNDIYMSTTGLREMTRFNIVRKNDLDLIENIIWSKMGQEAFSALNLQEIIQKTTLNSPRINAIKNLQRLKKDEYNEMYWLSLASCYIFTALGKLSLEKEGRGVVFNKNNDGISHSTDESAYNGMKFLNNINDNTAVFEMMPFYLEIRCNGFRGSIVPYMMEEIDYLSTIIEEMPHEQKRIEIEKLIDDIDYTNRIHKLYKLLESRNNRNDRDERKFFEQRIKSGLELVGKLKGTIKVLKDGRKKVFFVTPPAEPKIREPDPEKKSSVICCPQAAFDVRSFFESMEYFGSIRSSKFLYSCYRHNNTSLLLTETKKQAPFTVVRDRDLLLIEKVVLGKNKPKSFTADEVKQWCLERISTDSWYNHECQEKKESVALDEFVAACCFILAIKKKIIPYTDSEGVEKFWRGYAPSSQIIQKKAFFNNLKAFKPLDENFTQFNWGDSKWKISCRGYHGFITPTKGEGA